MKIEYDAMQRWIRTLLDARDWTINMSTNRRAGRIQIRNNEIGLDALTFATAYRVRQGNPYVAINVPQLGNLKATLRFERMLDKAEIPWVVLPLDTAGAAGVLLESVQILDSRIVKRGIWTLTESVFVSDIQLPMRWDGNRRINPTRTARFVSGADWQERMPPYFLSELPTTSTATSVDEALEDLKPPAVKLAESAGRTVLRQGDIFAIPMPEYEPTGIVQDKGMLFGTNHAVDKMVVVPGDNQSLIYGKGYIRHVPEGRRPDHKKLRLGSTWHLIVKNTVPIAE